MCWSSWCVVQTICIWKIEKSTYQLFPTQVFWIDLRIDFYPNLGGSWPQGFPSIKLSVRRTIPPLPWEHLSDNIVYSLAKEKDSLVKSKNFGCVAISRRLNHYFTIPMWFCGLKLLHIYVCNVYMYIQCPQELWDNFLQNNMQLCNYSHIFEGICVFQANCSVLKYMFNLLYVVSLFITHSLYV